MVSGRAKSACRCGLNPGLRGKENKLYFAADNAIALLGSGHVSWLNSLLG
jgi:hypothetical protein